jgi:hypothetical protein
LLGSELAGAVDFVFIDGDHSYDGLRADWLGWSMLVMPGGYSPFTIVGPHRIGRSTTLAVSASRRRSFSPTPNFWLQRQLIP